MLTPHPRKGSDHLSRPGRGRRGHSRAARWGQRRLATLLLAVVLAVTGLPAVTTAADQPSGEGSGAPGSAAASQSSDGGAQVTVSVSYTQAQAGSEGTGGSPVTTSTQVETTVLPVCWFEEGNTGQETAEFLERIATRDDAASIVMDYRNWEDHAEDAQGHWYLPTCERNRWEGDDDQDFIDLVTSFMEDNPPVYVEAEEAPPEPPVDGATLAAAAWDAVDIPVPEVGHNPSLGEGGATLVGWYTWVWAAGDTPTQVTATATAGPVTATVTATATGLDLSAPDAQVDCHGFGTPWNQGAEGTDCTVVFTRSSAHLGGTTPLTTSVRYEVSYTATDGAADTLDTVTTTSTHDIPVAEVQTLTTNPD
ncbi:hypothetical protein [Actinomyces lilanjuaniae]|uniref:hypothetical protein n=1 Tax=Actinomyces lilanjuaniae TaxID=2321394 RepID=UPI00242F2845|nr:hypothetical protein [Actinomyces lilanjuaniae]